MDKIEFIKFLDKMDRSQLEDYLEAVWRQEIELTPWQEIELTSRLRREQQAIPESYTKIYILMLALILTVPEYDGSVKRVLDALPEPPVPWQYDLMWVTHPEKGEVCEKCAALEGKIYGRDFGVKPELHPGCNCSLERVAKGSRAMKIRTYDAGAVRAVSEGQKRILEILAVPFGSMDRLDRYNQYLSPDTDYMVDVGDRRPLLYFHGNTPRGKPMKIPRTMGTAIVSKIDQRGIWTKTELPPEGRDELADITWEDALVGKARASSGSIDYLVRPQPVNGKWPKGKVDCWPLAEVSIFDTRHGKVPISDDAVVLPLRALYDEQGITLPDNFEAGEDKKEEEVKQPTIRTKGINMNEIEQAVQDALTKREAEAQAEQEKEAALRAKIEAELKEKPNYRATFNVNTIAGDKGLDADKLETFSFIRSLIEGGKTVAQGGIPRNAVPARAADLPLLETDAEELQMMVPEDLHNQIHDLLSAYSLPDKLSAAGLLPIYKTNRLIFNVPAEETALAALADIAEGGAYTANTPEFVNFAITMQKVGNYVSVSEEALEDQDLFQQWLVRACARSIALSKNVDFAGLLTAVAGTQIAATDVIEDAELIAAYYGLAQEYREKSCWFMNDSTLAYIRAMLVATPRAYGEFGFNPMSMGEVGEMLMNKPVYTNANWEAVVGGTDGVPGVTHVNLQEAMFWVERRRMSIFVDPYSTKLSAGTVNFLPSARYGGVIVNAAGIYNIDNNTE